MPLSTKMKADFLDDENKLLRYCNGRNMITRIDYGKTVIGGE
jgi:hypothetical protein